MADDQGSPGSPRERPDGGDAQDGRPAAAVGAGPGAEPGPLLADLARLRRQTRAARHAYWFPLILFGLLSCAAAPLYVAAAAPPGSSGAYRTERGPLLLGGSPLDGNGFNIGWYWAAALVGGYLLTVVWYRWHSRRAGVATPARGYLIIGVVLTLLSSLYNVENIVFRLGWNPGRSAFAWQLTALPNVLLPAAILLAAGCGAFLAQRAGRSTA